ncbi:MAG: acetylornithine/succinylornithine family transaminase [Betaproteobacteria bacterium]|nr:acetylornithine/succinylornithine family transaminase [Betaproteobacteria bacterium]
MSHVMNTYARQPLAFTRGEGVFLIDAAGKRYLDALAGVAVVSVGHCHPRLVKAIADQAHNLIHTSNIFSITLQERLADRLCALSGMENVFFCNSGCEANEAAIKLARLYGHKKGIEVPTIIVTEGSFHGRTMATLTATGSRKAQAGFEPLLAGFARVPYDDVTAVRQVAANNKNVVAMLVEPITGEGGVNIPAEGYLRELRAICDQNGWLFMLDEVQTGIGRTGKWFGFQHEGVRPDVMPLAKGLGGGVPIGACLAAGPAAQLFQPGKHGSTFGGNPLACAAALAVLDIMEEEGLVEGAAKTGDYLVARLCDELAETQAIRQIRGRGLMIAIELDRPCGELVGMALERGLIINVTADNVVRLVPPLVFNIEHADLLASTLVPLLREFIAGTPARSAA